MISQTNSSSIATVYSNNFGETKGNKASTNNVVSKQGDLTKIESLKESISLGEYKVDLEALSKKIAEELL